ncbi:hypothetical protein [Paenibacillus hexagrammi]|uniref:Uncharacterized protein n=1 Tax=Paenibacillus hexagrammi TaxID=2908839 RepID=A0ABY3SPE1_9BACL|nr:hypothetical protein [Paenibacillus sp. YPD9-1]UJF35569.1 hypothetical protein L0M14_10980 [Paenibacillus sp. YPD9-1]
MGSASRGRERLLGHLDHVERLLGSLERHKPEQHLRNAVKEWLLASRAVVDSVIESLEGGETESESESASSPASRKINIQE